MPVTLRQNNLLQPFLFLTLSSLPTGRQAERQRPDDRGQRRVAAGPLQPRRHGDAAALHVVGGERQGHHPAGGAASIQASTAAGIAFSNRALRDMERVFHIQLELVPIGNQTLAVGKNNTNSGEMTFLGHGSVSFWEVMRMAGTLTASAYSSEVIWHSVIPQLQDMQILSVA